LQSIAIKISNLINLPLYKKQAGYMFWAMSENLLNIGLPRLLLFPLAAYFVGKDQFGAFIMAISITGIIGFQPGNGLATGMFRQLSQHELQEQKLLCSTAAKMCSYAMLTLIVLGLIISFAVYQLTIIEPLLFYCIMPLLISLYPENQFMLNLTELRIRRNFARRTGWYSIRAILILVCGLAGMLTGDAIKFAWGYAIGNFAAYGFLLIYRKDWLNKGYDKSIAASLKEVWLHVTIAGIIAVSGPYLNRIILGLYHEYDDVADLFAASALLFASMIISICMGYVLLSVLARYKSIEDLPNSIRHQFLFVVVLLLVITPVVFWLVSPFVFSLVFPKFGEESKSLLNIVVWAVPFGVLISLMRPFIMKFSDIKIAPLVNILSLIGTLVPAILLVPPLHSVGGAWAIVIGQAVTGLLWTFFALRLFWFGR